MKIFPWPSKTTNNLLPPWSKNWNQNQVANDTRLKSNGKNCFRAECKCLFVIVFVLVLIVVVVVVVRWPNQPLQMDSLTEYKYWVTQSLSTYTLTHTHTHTLKYIQETCINVFYRLHHVYIAFYWGSWRGGIIGKNRFIFLSFMLFLLLSSYFNIFTFVFWGEK